MKGVTIRAPRDTRQSVLQLPLSIASSDQESALKRSEGVKNPDPGAQDENWNFYYLQEIGVSCLYVYPLVFRLDLAQPSS